MNKKIESIKIDLYSHRGWMNYYDAKTNNAVICKRWVEKYFGYTKLPDMATIYFEANAKSKFMIPDGMGWFYNGAHQGDIHYYLADSLRPANLINKGIDIYLEPRK